MTIDMDNFSNFCKKKPHYQHTLCQWYEIEYKNICFIQTNLLLYKIEDSIFAIGIFYVVTVLQLNIYGIALRIQLIIPREMW